jgi:hypothetical protein
MSFVEFSLNSGVQLTKGNKSYFSPYEVKWKMWKEFEILSHHNLESLHVTW